MDIKQLEYFICVAEYLSFTKAAEKFYISQTAISQQIKNLEKSLSVQLFIRNNRNVSLTPAGKAFLKKVKIIINEMNEAIHETAKIALGYNGSLNIGFTRGHNPHIVYSLTKKFINQYPDIDITIIDDNMGNLYEQLKNKTLDLIFSVDFNLNDIKEFESLTINTEQICAVMNCTHPLAHSKKLNRSDLKNEKFVFLERSEAPTGYDKMISNCIRDGFSPNLVKHCNSLESLSLLIRLGIGISLFPKFHLSAFTDDLVFIPLEGEEEEIKHVLIWNTLNSNPAMELFLKSIK